MRDLKRFNKDLLIRYMLMMPSFSQQKYFTNCTEHVIPCDFATDYVIYGHDILPPQDP